MFEFNGTTYLSQNDRDMAEINYLQEKLTTTEANLAWANSRIESLASRTNRLQATIDNAKALFEEILAGDTNAQQTFEDFREPFEALGVELVTEREITVTATWTLTVKTAKSYLSDWDFNVPDIEADSDELEIIESDVRIDVAE